MARQPLNNNRRDSVEEPRTKLKLQDLETMLRIDEHQLEVEWQHQPDCYHKVKKELAYAISERDEAMRMVKEIMAEVETFIRNEASNNEEKVTDKAVEAQVKIDRTVLAAQKKAADLSLHVGLVEALVGAFAHRRDALDNLVKLYLGDYYGSGDNSPSRNDLRNATAEKAREAQREARIKARNGAANRDR